LEIAKSLLKNQFDFIITEYFSQPRTISAIVTALHNSLDPPASFMTKRDNGGMHTNRDQTKNKTESFPFVALLRTLNTTASINSTVPQPVHTSQRRRLSASQSYRKDIPADVIAHLEKENAEDIELYKFALKEFEDRSKNEQWV
jgi:hypothetical protein